MKRKYSKIGISVVLMLTLMFSLVLPCSAAQKVEVVNDGKQLIVKINGEQVNCDQQPYIANNCTMVPVSIIAKQFGAKVDWNPATMTVTIKGEKVVVLTIGSTTAKIDSSPITLQAPATATGGRTMVPLRFVGESLGAEVVYTQIEKPLTKKAAVDMKAQEISVKLIKPNMQEIDKAFAIYHYLTNNSIYGFGPNCYTAYGNLIDGVSVCAGYALAACTLFDAVGMENYYVVGKFGSGDHGWNIVKIDNQYYHFDATRQIFIMNDLESKNSGYRWNEKAFPKCESDLKSTIKRKDAWFINNGYVYYPSEYLNIKDWLDDSPGTPKNIYKIRPDGSGNTKVFTTKHAASDFVIYDNWVYYFDYYTQQGVYKVQIDGSDDTKVSDRSDIGSIYVSNGYLFIQHKDPVHIQIIGSPSTKVKKKKIDIILHRINLETHREDEIILEQGLDERFFIEGIGDYIYYIKPESGTSKFIKMTLDGKQKNVYIDNVDPITRHASQ